MSFKQVFSREQINLNDTSAQMKQINHLLDYFNINRICIWYAFCGSTSKYTLGPIENQTSACLELPINQW